MGKHSGPSKEKRSNALPQVLLLALATTATVVAWGYLVVEAVDFGVMVRNGKSDALVLLIMATIGAMACLFLALILVTRALRALGGLGAGGAGGSGGRGGRPGRGGRSPRVEGRRRK